MATTSNRSAKAVARKAPARRRLPRRRQPHDAHGGGRHRTTMDRAPTSSSATSFPRRRPRATGRSSIRCRPVSPRHPQLCRRRSTCGRPGGASTTRRTPGSCVGWATADGVARYHMVQAGRIGQDTLLSPRHVWMASKETDTITSRPESFIEGAGTTLKAALDVVRKHGVALMDDLPFHIQTKMYTGRREHVLRGVRAAQDRVVLQPADQPAELEVLARHERTDPCRAERRRRGTTPPPRAATSTRSNPTRSAAVTRSASSATEPTAGSSSATVGARVGGTAASATSRRRTSPPDSSTSPTASPSDSPYRSRPDRGRPSQVTG